MESRQGRRYAWTLYAGRTMLRRGVAPGEVKDTVPIPVSSVHPMLFHRRRFQIAPGRAKVAQRFGDLPGPRQRPGGLDLAGPDPFPPVPEAGDVSAVIVLPVVQHPRLPIQIEKLTYPPGYRPWIGSEILVTDGHPGKSLSRRFHGLHVTGHVEGGLLERPGRTDFMPGNRGSARVAEQENEPRIRPAGGDALPDECIARRLVDNVTFPTALQLCMEHTIPEQIFELAHAQPEPA